MTVRSGYGNGSGYGYRRAGVGRARLRTSTTDRERAIALLKNAFAEGRLTKDEYDERAGRALTARTYSDLDGLVVDLPAPLPPRPARAPRTNPLAAASLACGVAMIFTLGLTALPAVVLGHVSRHQIRRTGEAGAGLALAGLSLGWAALVVAILGFILAVTYTAIVVHLGLFPGRAG